VLVENYRVGVSRRLGIDARCMRQTNPDLIYLSLSSQGQDGPEAENSSYGSTLDLLSGLASVTGYEPDRPLWSSTDVNHPEQLVSLFGAALVVYCLERGKAGFS
jgi:crotonobetainyl-CoA:carnitine CoA-transferase CaiB-like acyl-CoA transferase